MNHRRYYSVRTGHDPKKMSLDLSNLRRLVYATYLTFVEKAYFQEALGYYCVDAGDVHGTMGTDPQMYATLRLREADLFPLQPDKEYTEDNLFDLIEFQFDHISQPIKGWYHDYSGCGWHYTHFDKDMGQEEFCAEVNNFLQDYGDGWELSPEGEILSLGGPGLRDIFAASIPTDDHDNINQRITAAIRKFRRHGSSMEDRGDAVRALADILEYLRPEAQRLLTKKDESDLFELANRFGIRHYNKKQQTDYDHDIWLSWTFYYYLATIHALLRIIGRDNTPGTP